MSKKQKLLLFKKICSRLDASDRGRLFLVNLLHGIDKGFIPVDKLGKALWEVDRAVLKGTVDDILGHLKVLLKHPKFGLSMTVPVPNATDFSPDGHLVSVMTLLSFEKYYRPFAVATSGHAFGVLHVGSKVAHVVSPLSTGPCLWVTPMAHYGMKNPANMRAQHTVERLGLVHIRDGVDCFVLSFTPDTPTCFLPTVVDANPNARFRQIDPLAPAENRWGRTVDLALLAKNPTPADIGGRRERVLAKYDLLPTNDAHFTYLGRTDTDLDIARHDSTLLALLLAGTSFTSAVTTLQSHLFS